MMKLGLTGSIATGKSTTLQAFADLGVPVFSSDDAVHALYAGEAVAPVDALFPGVGKDGVIDRAELSRRLIADPSAIKRLEAVVHPLVREKIATFLRDSEAKGAFLAVVDIPLLFENGYDYGIDAVAVTICDPVIQRKRALARPGMTVEKFETILARQMPQAEKISKATYVFDTDHSVKAMREMVQALVEAIRVRQRVLR